MDEFRARQGISIEDLVKLQGNGGAETAPADHATEADVGEADEKACPDCAETVKAAAKVCRYCGYRFVRPTAPPAPRGAHAPRPAPGGFRDGLKNVAVDEPPPPHVAHPMPTGFGERLGHFGAYDSKAQFMIDWAASIFREAGQSPSEHVDGIRDMANIACFSQIWFRLRNVADGNGDRRTAAYLDSLDRQALLTVVDTVYPTAIEMSGRCGGMQDGPMMASFKSKMADTFDNTFRACRAEFIEGVHKGAF